MQAARSEIARSGKSWLRRRLEIGAGSVLVAAVVATLPAEATVPRRDDEALATRAAAARAALQQMPRAIRDPQLELAWWGNWHNWGWHPWWHNWPNWRNWSNWGNGPGVFAGCG